MLEYGVIEHGGNRFQAGGAFCNGHDLTAYVKSAVSGRMVLSNWSGKDLIELRCSHGESWIVNDFRDEAMTILLNCGKGHWIGGLSLGEGMLFRGEHFTADNAEDAMQTADSIAERWAQIDYEDFQQDQYEQQ
jgi:hypothetical protein